MNQFRRAALLALLLAFPAFYALRPIEDNDIFFHIRVGGWIAEHHRVTDTDPFTVFGQGKPYVAYAWIFQLLVNGAHAALGWRGILAFEAVLALAIALAVFRLVSRQGPPFTKAAAITGLALTAMLRSIGPRSWLFTILFFTLELDWVLAAREAKNERRLFALVPFFLVWANLHIEFVHGLVLLFLLGIECLVERRPPWTILGAGIACTLATLVNPYGIGLWRTILEYGTASGAYAVIQEHAPLSFHELSDWCGLLLAVFTAVALVWKRERRVFPYLLLAFGAVLGFRSGRDGFALATTAAALLARALATDVKDDFPNARAGYLPVLGASALLLLAAAWGRGLSEARLEESIARVFPAEAAAFVERENLEGPIFNDYDWGSYLIWRLPRRLVAIDGRTNLHGDARILRSRAVWSGAAGWDQDEDLARSATVIAPHESPLTALLVKDPRFVRVHEDPVATVFTRKKGP
jgi:hypothetical protein